MAERGWNSSIEISPNCPRCGSCNTKFCYYNNYSLTQPRYFCKGCKRYWTKGGSLRNVPVGGGCRKSRRRRSIHISTSTHLSSGFREIQGSSPSSFCIDIAQVYANYLNQANDDTETRIRLSTPQSANDSYICHISSPSSYMQTDFSSCLVPLQMDYEAFNQFTNLHDQVVDDLPPLPGEEALQISTTGWGNELIFENVPQLASIELEVPHSENHLITYCKSSIDRSSYDTFFQS